MRPREPAANSDGPQIDCPALAPEPAGRGGITPAEEDWKAKIMRGDCYGGAVRLTPIEDLVIVAEKIETSLSILRELFSDELRGTHIDGQPVAVWCALSQSNMGGIGLPLGVREVILGIDNVGKIPAEHQQKEPEEIMLHAAQQHANQGRNVSFIGPPRGLDFNNLAQSIPAGQSTFREEVAPA